MPRTLFGKFLAILRGFGAMMTAIFASIMQWSHENHHLELDQRAAKALASQIVAQGLGGVAKSGAMGAPNETLARLAM